MLGRGSGTNPYVISVTALVKKIGKEGPMPYIFWRLIFCLFPSHRHRHHSCRMPFFAPLLPFHFEGGATLLIRFASLHYLRGRGIFLNLHTLYCNLVHTW